MKRESRDELKIVKPEDILTMSIYGMFHCQYRWYDFKSLKDGRIYSKGEFWDAHKEKAISLTKRNRHLSTDKEPYTPFDFELVPYNDRKTDTNVIVYPVNMNTNQIILHGYRHTLVRLDNRVGFPDPCYLGNLGYALKAGNKKNKYIEKVK